MQSYRHLARILMLFLIGFFVVSLVSDLVFAGGSAGSPAISGAHSVDDNSVSSESDEQAAGENGDEHDFPDRTKELHNPGIIGNLVTLLMLVVLQAVYWVSITCCISRLNPRTP